MDKPKPKKKVSNYDVEKALKGILGWVQKEKQNPTPPRKSKSGKLWGWVVGIFISILVFFSLAIVAWKAWKRGKEIAKLKHQVDVNEEKKRWLLIDRKLDQNRENQSKMDEEILSVRHEIEEAKIKIGRAERERVLAHKTIDKISSWADVDHLLDGK